MKRLYYALLGLAIFSLVPSKLNAQCNGCQISLPNLSVDTIYMDSIPNAGVNTAYEEAISFRFPHTTNSMSSFGVPAGITIQSITLNNMSGLPAGLTYTFGQSPATYNQAMPTPRDGCLTICGTPNDTGTFPVILNCTVNVQFVGATPIAVPLVMKVVCFNTTSTLNITACDSFISPSGKVWTQSNTYYDTIPNAAGCDSIITVNLTVPIINTGISQVGELLMAIESAADSIFWINCSTKAILPGYTSKTVLIDSNGSYAAVLYKDGCSDTTGCMTINNGSTGIEYNELAMSSQLYPNPSDGHFNLDLGKRYGNIQITVTDISGKAIAKRNYASAQQLELMFHEKPGIYFVEIEADGYRTVSRVILK
ncbi:MAG: T9SS type A sorting domain-containing protein [Bacteroidetes bacterium]|nr:MAG: T9SS type A sorting domain-containing protein [Bacteroidota bacterium]